MFVLPDNPFDEVNDEFAYANGKTLLLVIDDYSRFPFVEPVSPTSASAVMANLDQITDGHPTEKSLLNSLKCLVSDIAR